MTKLFKAIACFLLCTFTTLSHTAFAQVSAIKENVKADKEMASRLPVKVQPNTSEPDDIKPFSEFWNPEGIAQTIAAYTVGAALYGAYYTARWGQLQTLRNYNSYPDRISFEATGNVLIDIGNGNIGYQPGARFNWGLFASDVRFVHIEDYTGKLQSIDWQVPILRIPIKNLKMEYGIGGITILEPARTYFESRVGLDWRFLNQHANCQAYYRWSQRTRSGGRYREEAGLQLDYITHQWDKWRLAPMLGYTFQRYFGGNDMNFIKAGLVIKHY